MHWSPNLDISKLQFLNREQNRSREARKAKQSPTQDQVDAATHIFKGYVPLVYSFNTPKYP
jgi:hypothetical protein